MVIKGIGHTQLSELSSAIKLPSISCISDKKQLLKLGDVIKDSTFEEMIKAGNEERQLALDTSNVDENGVPMWTVIVNGQWSKCSHRTKCNAYYTRAVKIFFLNMCLYY